jgi:hypothetical protein
MHPEPDGFNVHYSLSRDDYVEYVLRKTAGEQLWPTWRQRLMVFIAAVATSVLTCAMTAELTQKSLLCAVIVALIFSVALTARGPWTTESVRQAYKRFYDGFRDAGICEPQDLTLNADDIDHRCHSQHNFAKWNAVCEVGVVEGFAYLTMFSSGALVPRRAFADEAAFRAFVAKIAQYHKQASSERQAATNATHAFPVVQRAVNMSGDDSKRC